MLPMGFAPRSSGALVNTLAPAMLIAEVDASTGGRRCCWRRISTPVCARMTVSLPALPPALPRWGSISTRLPRIAHGLSRSRTDSGKRLHNHAEHTQLLPRNIHVTLILKSRPILRDRADCACTPKINTIKQRLITNGWPDRPRAAISRC
jgi:hypothetical protein